MHSVTDESVVVPSDADQVAAILARSRLRVSLAACGVLLVVIVAVVVAQVVGPGGAVPRAVGVLIPLPWFGIAVITAGRPSRARLVHPQRLQALTMATAFAAIYLFQAGFTWVITVVFMTAAVWGVGIIVILPYFRWQLRRHPSLVHDRARVSGATLARRSES